MIEKVKVTATYTRASQVPRIGQRKQMRVNGRSQFLTLNDLHVERRGAYDDDKEYFVYEFDTQEEWGDFFIS
jgi:hypothetical protein